MEFSPALQTLYADLLQQLLDRPEWPGTVYTQRKGGAAYLYARRNIGMARVDTFLGPATDTSVMQQVARIKEEQKLARQRRKIVNALKQAGMPRPTLMLARLLDVVSYAGIFRQGVLVGTAAYQCYPSLLGVALPISSLMTQDADIATLQLSVAAQDGPMSLLDILKRADPSFRELPGLKRGAPPSSFRSANGFRVDLLTQVLRRTDRNPLPLKNLSAGATPLQHLAWLVREPVPAAVLAGAGILVRVPQAARFAVHKLIVAQKRASHERGKRQKDLVQAGALIEALEKMDPEALDDALRSARRQGKEGWRLPIERSLKEIGRL